MQTRSDFCEEGNELKGRKVCWKSLKKCREAESSEVKSYLMRRVAQCSKVQ